MQNNRFGVMLDMSRNHVLKADKVKEFVSVIKKFNYNTLMLYTEDTYEVENEGYFGYLRGGYSVDEIKDIDAYCKEQGVELIPCIQTLAHLKTIFKWAEYDKAHDTGDILLCGEERTYQLIENIFITLKKAFSSRVVHIGMDEAEMMGLGKYLHKNGYQNRFSILNKHLERVMAIAKKYGFKPIIWSDMFFKLGNNGEYYLKNLEDFDTSLAKPYVPKDLGLVFWDYYHADKKVYDDMITAHNQLSNNVWFAGGAWTWVGFAPFNKLTLKNMIPAMQSCRERGVKDIIITCWGDNGGECSPFAILPSLYHIKRVYDGETDENKIKEEFFSLTGEKYDDMVALDLPNDICGNTASVVNPCKYALYSDLFSGFIDASLPDGGEIEYKKHAKKLKELSKNSRYGYIYDSLFKLCSVLSIKYNLGVRIRSAYKSGDKEQLKECVKDINTTIKRVEKFYYAFRNQWLTENKPHGFEVQDARLGGLMRRMKTCAELLSEYLSGKSENILELEQELLPYYCGGEKIKKGLVCENIYADIVSVNNL